MRLMNRRLEQEQQVASFLAQEEEVFSFSIARMKQQKKEYVTPFL